MPSKPKDRFFYCAKCKTLTSNYAPCVNCNVLPQPCSVTSHPSLIAMIPESPKKSSTVDQSPVSSAPASQVALPVPSSPVISSPVPSSAAATLSQQLMSSAGQLKPLQRIIVMQSGLTPTKQVMGSGGAGQGGFLSQFIQGMDENFLLWNFLKQVRVDLKFRLEGTLLVWFPILPRTACSIWIDALKINFCEGREDDACMFVA